MVSYNRLSHTIDCKRPSSASSSFPKISFVFKISFSFPLFYKTEVKEFMSEVEHSHCGSLDGVIDIEIVYLKIKALNKL